MTFDAALRPSPVDAGFVSRHQRALLERIYAQPRDADPYCDYGLVVHARRENGRMCFGIITPSGESLPLTERLLFTLGFERCRLPLGSLITLLPGDAREDEQGDDRPLDTLWIELTRLRADGSPKRIGYQLRAEDFERVTTVLVEKQPLGWPV